MYKVYKYERERFLQRSKSDTKKSCHNHFIELNPFIDNKIVNLSFECIKIFWQVRINSKEPTIAYASTNSRIANDTPYAGLGKVGAHA